MRFDIGDSGSARWRAGASALLLIAGLALFQINRERLWPSGNGLNTDDAYARSLEPAARGAASQKAADNQGEYPPPPPVGVPRRSPEADAVIRELAALTSCFDDDSCGTRPEYIDAQDDPRGLYFAVVGRMKNLLEELRTQKKRSIEIDFTEEARTYLRFPDDHVKSAALGLLSEHMPDEQNVEALILGLESSHSAPLFEQAMAEFGRHATPTAQALISGFLTQTLTTGGLKSGEIIAANLLPLITPETYDTYREALRQVPAGSRRSRDLKKALQEFSRMQNGG